MAVSLPTEFIQRDWQFGHDASDFSRHFANKIQLTAVGREP